MPVRPFHHRRQSHLSTSTECMLGDMGVAERLEDRTLLSAVTERAAEMQITDFEQQLVDEDFVVETYADDLERLVVSFLESRLAYAETANFEPSVEHPDHSGAIRLTAFSFDAAQFDPRDLARLQFELLDLVELGRIDVLTEDFTVGTNSISVTDGNDSNLFLVHAVVDVEDSKSGLTTTYVASVLVHHVESIFDSLSSDEVELTAVPSSLGGTRVSSDLTLGISSNVPNFLPESEDTVISDDSLDESSLPLTRSNEFVTNSSTPEPRLSLHNTSHPLEPLPVATTILVSDGETQFMTRRSLSESGFSEPTFLEASLARWTPTEVSLFSAVASSSAPLINRETENLLASIGPSEFSNTLADPLEPLIGFAGTLVVMLQTVGRTALLAVFGDAGTGGGPIAEFVEPIIDLADVGQAPERWELKTVDTVSSEPLAQAVTSDRHFEIRNIGPAADLDENLPDVATLTLLTLPQHGVLEHVGVRNNVFRYVPDPGFSGVDQFRYRMKTASGSSLEGQMVVTVPALSAPGGFRTATREIELRLEPQVELTATITAFERFEDWRGGLD